MCRNLLFPRNFRGARDVNERDLERLELAPNKPPRQSPLKSRLAFRHNYPIRNITDFLLTAMSNTETALEQSARVALEKKLAQRPDKQELIDNNILPGTYFLIQNISGEWEHGNRRSHFLQLPMSRLRSKLHRRNSSEACSRYVHTMQQNSCCLRLTIVVPPQGHTRLETQEPPSR